MRYPVAYRVVVSPYGVQRSDGRWHWGVDLGGSPGTEVVAPEDLIVVRTWTDDASPPFVGYGPGGVLARGTGVAGQHYHLLAHLDPADIPDVNAIIREGQHVGVMSGLAHVHWEIRSSPVDSPSTRQANTVDPDRWVRGGGGSSSAILLLLALWLIARR